MTVPAHITDRPDSPVNAHNGKILIVEDDHLIALDAESALRQAGFEIVGIAATAAVALEIARQRHPDLVLMDYRLAGSKDGVETALELVQSAGTRCVFATAQTDIATRQRAEVAAPLGWVTKPYSPTDLVRVINLALSSL